MCCDRIVVVTSKGVKFQLYFALSGLCQEDDVHSRFFHVARNVLGIEDKSEWFDEALRPTSYREQLVRR